MGFFDAGPKAVEFAVQQIRFVEQHGSTRQEIEDGAVGSCNGRVELPSGKNSHPSGPHRRFDDFLSRSRDALS